MRVSYNICVVPGVDVYFSPFKDTYIVDTDRHSGIHHVTIDPKYEEKSRRRRTTGTRHRRDTDDVPSNVSVTSYTKRVVNAADFNTFVLVAEPNTFLVVRGVYNRLVITLPNHVHNLKELRFYLLLYGVGNRDQTETFGNMFFRQDQPHIDLFVFFSVFFSCFFLFLAVCVVLWKTKQAYDARRSHAARKIEMKHMASRPFARALVAVDAPTDFDAPTGKVARKSRTLWLTSRAAHASNVLSDEFHVNPLTLEPTDDGVAVIGTMFVQLPGDSSLAVRACLGSSLMTMRVMYPTLHHFPKTILHHNASSSVA